MSAYLATAVEGISLPLCSGVSARACRTVLKMMAKIAQNDGTMRYGLRASKLAALCDYSLATVRRAEAFLVKHGFIERVTRGGGRASTHWRVVLHKLGVAPDPRHATTPDPTRQPCRYEWGHERTQLFSKMSHRAPAHSTLVTSTCDLHGGDGGVLPDGRPRCPQCRWLSPVTRR